jgi:retron-type reverse transcriptase
MFEDIISVENLLGAWRKFLRGKRHKPDVQEFGLHLMDNIFSLHRGLVNRTYKHGGYQSFNISDPKPRNIHKASVRDRLLHHAVYRVLCPYFDRKFISDSFSCRIEKGTHKALARFRAFAYKVSKNNTKTCWVLKGDIRKFFASVDQDILTDIIKIHIQDNSVLWFLDAIIRSFHSTQGGKGLPLGNLTSQLLVNVYMNEFDQFVKHELKVKYYLRYADDFVTFSDNKWYLEGLILQIDMFLRERLGLVLHPQKISIGTLASGVDFLGWVHFPDHRVLRTATERRMIKRMAENQEPGTLVPYLGLLRYGNAEKLKKRVYNFA